MVKLRIHNFDDPDLPLECQIIKQAFTLPDNPVTGYDKFIYARAKLKLLTLINRYRKENRVYIATINIIPPR